MAEDLSPNKKVTPQQKKFVRYFLETQKVGESALRAGYCDKSYGSYLYNQPKIREAIIEAMERKGLKDEFLAKKLKEGLEATYPPQLYKDGSTKQPEHPDFLTRGTYLDKAFKIRGDYAPEKHEYQQRSVQLVVNVDFKSAQGLLDSGAINQLEYQELQRLGEGNGIDRRAKEGVGRQAPGGAGTEENGGGTGCPAWAGSVVEERASSAPDETAGQDDGESERPGREIEGDVGDEKTESVGGVQGEARD